MTTGPLPKLDSWLEGKESKEGRQTVFSTPSILFGSDKNEEKPSEDHSKPRKVHFHSNWRRYPNAVHLVKLSRAQDHGLQFWQTKSNAIVVYDSVPEDCIEGRL